MKHPYQKIVPPTGSTVAPPWERSREVDSGYTLAEAIVSIALLVLFSVSATIAILTLIQTTRITQNRVAAANLARQEIERLRGQNSTASQLDSAAQTVTLKGMTYTLTPTMNPGAVSACAPGATRKVSVVVAWNNSGTRSVRYDTVLSC